MEIEFEGWGLMGDIFEREIRIVYEFNDLFCSRGKDGMFSVYGSYLFSCARL